MLHKGTTEGQYSSYLMMSGISCLDEAANSNLEHGFGLLGLLLMGCVWCKHGPPVLPCSPFACLLD